MSLQRAEQKGAADAAVGFWQTGQGTPTGYAVFGTASTPDLVGSRPVLMHEALTCWSSGNARSARRHAKDHLFL